MCRSETGARFFCCPEFALVAVEACENAREGVKRRAIKSVQILIFGFINQRICKQDASKSPGIC
jgi:hypothetical protein